MSGWSPEDLAALRVDELRLASRRPDGSIRPFATIWFVAVGDELYVRSAYGPENGWYRRAAASGSGRIEAGRLGRDVTFERTDASIDAEVTAAFHAKYDRYAPDIVGTVVSDEAVRCTLRVRPA